MTVDLGAMVADLVLKDAEFNRNLERAGRNVSSFSSKSNRALARTERQWKETSRAAKKFTMDLKTMGTAVLGVAGVGGLGMLIKSSLEAGDSIAKTADAIGISTDALQQYRYIAERSGVTTEQLDKGMGAFSKRLGELRAGTGALNTLLNKNNTALRDQLVQAGSTSEALDIYFNALKDVENQSDRNALSAAAFSRTAGIAMTVMIDNIDTLRERYARLGVSIDEDMLRKTEAAKDNIDDLQLVIRNSLTTAVVSLAPEIGNAADQAARWVAENKAFLTQDVPGHVRETASAIGEILRVYNSIPDYITGPAGMGLVGAAVLGRTPGKIIFVLTLLNQTLHATGNGLQDIMPKANAVNQAIINLWNSIFNAGESQEKFNFELKASHDQTGIYKKDLKETGDKTGNLADQTDALTEAIKRAREEQERWEADAAIRAIQYAEEAREEYWQNYIENMNAVIAAEKAAYEDAQQAKTEAEEKAIQDRQHAEERARQEYLREWERVYDDMHRFAADTFYNIFDGQLDSFEDFTDEMLNIFKRMLANMMAEAAMTNIFKPLMNQIAGSFMGDFFGLPSAGGMGFPNIGGLSGLPGMGWLGSAIPGTSVIGSELGWGAAAAQDIGVMSSPGVTWGQALGAGALGSLGYTYIGDAIGLPQSEYSGITSGVGAGIGFTLGGPIGGAAGALLGGLAGSLFGGDADPSIAFSTHNPETPEGYYPGSGWAYGAKTTDYDFRIGVKDTDQDPVIGKQVVDYFHTLFSTIDKMTVVSMQEVLQARQQSGMLHIVQGAQKDLKSMSSAVFSGLVDQMVSEVTGGGAAGAFSPEFFKQLAPEGGNEWDAFIQFANVVGNTTDFLEKFTRQMDEFGESAVDAYQNIQAITGIMEQIRGMSDAVNIASSFQSDLEGINNTFEVFILTLKDANATLDEVNEAERTRNQLLGARITGLNASDLMQTVTSGGNISSILQKSITDALASEVSTAIMQKYLTPLNEVIGVVWRATGDIESVMKILDGYDLSGANEEIQQFQKAITDMFGDLTETVTEEMENGIEDARAMLDRAIDKEWELANARLSAANQIDDLISSLMGSDYAPVQSLEFFQKRYQQLLSEAQSADTAEEISRAVDNLTGFVPQYLDFAKAYGGTDYNMLFQQITSDLRTIEDSQRTEAERQIDQLERINSILGVMSEDVLDINVALQRYLAAVRDAESSSGTVTTPTTDPATDTGGSSTYDPVLALYETIGRTGFGDEVWEIDQGGYDYWTDQLQFRDLADVAQSFYDSVDMYMQEHRGTGDEYADYLESQGFAKGGVISGPSSGYRMPDAVYHGTEAIIPMNGAAIPVQVQNESREVVTALRDLIEVTRTSGGNVAITLKIDGPEFRNLIREAISTDPEIQRQIRRVA